MSKLSKRMKSIGITTALFVGFFALWLAIVSFGFAIIPNLNTNNEAARRLWDEVVPLIGVVLATVIFYRFFDRKTSVFGLKPRSAREIVAYTGLGLVWLGLPIGVLLAFGTLHFTATNHIATIGVWLLAALLNVIMQEVLVRGYLFQVVLRRHNVTAAVVLTTGLFLALHGGEGGVLGILNVVATSLLLSLPVVYARSLFGSIVLHAIWNLVGAIALGCVSLGGVYPQFMVTKLSGPSWLTGGAMLIEGSVVTLAVTCMLLAGTWLYMRRQSTAEGRLQHSQKAAKV